MLRQVRDTDVIRTVMKENGIKQTELMEKLGYSTQSAISELINRKRASLEKVIAALNKMGYSVVVKRHGVDVFEIVTDWIVGSEEVDC